MLINLFKCFWPYFPQLIWNTFFKRSKIVLTTRILAIDWCSSIFNIYIVRIYLIRSICLNVLNFCFRFIHIGIRLISNHSLDFINRYFIEIFHYLLVFIQEVIWLLNSHRFLFFISNLCGLRIFLLILLISILILDNLRSNLLQFCSFIVRRLIVVLILNCLLQHINFLKVIPNLHLISSFLIYFARSSLICS